MHTIFIVLDLMPTTVGLSKNGTKEQGHLEEKVKTGRDQRLAVQGLKSKARSDLYLCESKAGLMPVCWAICESVFAHASILLGDSK